MSHTGFVFKKTKSCLKKKNSFKRLGFANVALLTSACCMAAWKLTEATATNGRDWMRGTDPWVPEWHGKAGPMKQSHRYGRNQYSTLRPATHRTCPEHSREHKMRSKLHYVTATGAAAKVPLGRWDGLYCAPDVYSLKFWGLRFSIGHQKNPICN